MNTKIKRDTFDIALTKAYHPNPRLDDLRARSTSPAVREAQRVDAYVAFIRKVA